MYWVPTLADTVVWHCRYGPCPRGVPIPVACAGAQGWGRNTDDTSANLTWWLEGGVVPREAAPRS